ncbi:hypothetical protein TI03_07270 [Achromatium sp. WMS1]|nr:hypothetical protein TI03_07270 [Achromatium sp. WMS1]
MYIYVTVVIFKFCDDIITELKDYNCYVDVHDPWVTTEEAYQEYGIKPIAKLDKHNNYDAIVLAVAHQQFKDMGAHAIRALGKPNMVLYDLKYIFKTNETDLRL